MKILKVISIHPATKQLGLQDRCGVIWYKTYKSISPFKVGMKLEQKVGY